MSLLKYLMNHQLGICLLRFQKEMIPDHHCLLCLIWASAFWGIRNSLAQTFLPRPVWKALPQKQKSRGIITERICKFIRSRVLKTLMEKLSDLLGLSNIW